MVKRNSKPDGLHSETDRSLDTQFTDDSSLTNWRLSARTPAWQPPTDVYELEEILVVRVEIAGMREEGFSIQLNGRILSIRGARQDVTERRAYHQMEIRFGEFSIDLELPVHVDPEQVQATYNNGFLRVQLPKARPRQISIMG
jgi:HSP20 family protein